ncbi:MAG: flavodoxin family protein [Candidatus Omnitrophica bacterium]|nr:flavodoxin family protein [Candidatus Omnitrophota bacterium]
MKVVAINGSPRSKGNTAILMGRVFDVLQKEGIQTEMIQLGGHLVRGCRACYKCSEIKNGLCNVDDDVINAIISKMSEADGIILGSPTYVTDVTTEMKALIDRATLVARANGHMFRRKVGAAVVAVRRAGATHVFDTMNHFFSIHQMVVAGSNYWNMGFGREPGQVETDEEGLKTMEVLGENMSWLLKKLR